MNKSLWPQWLATSQVFLMALMVGVTIGWLSPTLGKLARPNPPFEATEEQTTWLASLVSISQAFGAIAATIVTPRFGSKVAVYISGLIFFFGWIFLIYSNSITFVFISLICSGVGMGKLYSAYPLYIGEISDPTIRGRLVSFVVHGLMVGSLTGNIMGAHLDPWVYASINLVPNFLFLVAFTFVPNTPHHLVRSKKFDQAAHAIKWYTRNIDADKDLEVLADFLAANPKLSLSKTFKQLTSGVTLKILVLLNIFFCVLQFCGIYTIIVYMEILFIEARITVISPSSLVSIVNMLGVPASWVAMYTNDKFGRTTILLVSCTILAISKITWGIHYHLLNLGFSDPNLQWITIISSSIYRCTLTIGIFTMIPTLMGEMFAPNVKSLSTCICLIIIAICTFLSQKYFILLVSLWTYKYVFYVLALLTLISGLYAKLVIPETKGKSLQEIQDILNKKEPEEADLESRKKLVH